MKSTDVYAVLRAELGPTLKGLGFKREKAFLSWSREHGGQHTVLWCQVSRDGWDEYAGSKFVVELQRSQRPEAGAPAGARARIAKLLSDEQRAEVWRLQNQVILSLRRAPTTHPTLQVSAEVTKWYLDKFALVPAPYRAADDVWLRYARPEHVAAWAALLRRVLPSCIDIIESEPAPAKQ